jgi:argininosuccinate lyase
VAGPMFQQIIDIYGGGKMRGRNRIKSEMSEYFRDKISKPGIVAEYEHGFEEMILLNKAYAKMLFVQKILTEEEEKVIVDGLEYVRTNFSEDDIDGKYEELYFNMEQKLLQKIGIKVGGKLHTGRSRNDIYATLWRMETRKSIWGICQKVIELEKSMLVLAHKYKDTIITGYTHMQPAQPITVGYYYTAAIGVLHRDFARLEDAYKRTNLSPFGAAALAGTGFPIDREKLEKLLGFEGIVINNLDCVGSKDYLLEVESALTILMINISRMVQDHYIWCTNEFGYAEVGGEVAVCSSIMPQKKNPVTLEMIRAKAAHVMGTFVSGCAILKNTPFSLCMDLFESHTEYWFGYSSSLDSVRLFTETLSYLTFNTERAYSAAKGNFCTVTALADFLVSKFDISFSEAHDIVGDMVGVILDAGKPIGAMDSGVLRTSSRNVIARELIATDEEIIAVLEPASNVRAKTNLGSPGEASVENMLYESDILIKSQENWLQEKIGIVEGAYQEIV